VLEDRPVCELQGAAGVAAVGGCAVLPWRGAWLAATARGLDARDASQELATASFDQCLVHLQKSRPATWCDLAEAWRLLAPGGRLLLCGGNELGISSAGKRLARELDQSPRILANRAHARVLLFRRDDGAGPEPGAPTRVELPGPDGQVRVLHAEPGVFSAKRLDAGSALLIARLAQEPPPERVLDLGCGIGPLALSALLRWPASRALLLDADVRSVRSARVNAAALGLAPRCRVAWWDAAEALPEAEFDLVLLNPPFHQGKAVALAPARDLFRALAAALAPRGRALVVANRSLPYEADLSALGELSAIGGARGYKLLSLCRRARSDASSRRRSPGSRSAGRS